MRVKGNGLAAKDVHNILLIQLGDIGDVVLSLPCIRTLRERFPDAGITVAVREKARELIEECGWATGVISVSKNRRGLVAEMAYQKDFLLKLLRPRFDLAIDLRTGTRGALLAFLSGAAQRIGFFDNEGGWLRNRAFTDLTFPKVERGQHLAEYYHSILDEFGLQATSVRPVYKVPKKRKQEVLALFAKEKISLDQPVVAVQPFSLWRYKDWSAKKYAQLITRISSEFCPQVVITGSPAERDRAWELLGMCPIDTVHNLVGETSIGLLAGVLAACRLFVGGDSSGMHLSAAVGTPTVSIFGPSSAAAWAPRGEEHVVVQKDLPCVPCDRKGCNGIGMSRCLEELTVVEVMAAVTKQMKRLYAKECREQHADFGNKKDLPVGEVDRKTGP
jgi:lipopolysaccharide heptosyltransferase II